MSNPFEANSSGGPRYGNAYENTPSSVSSPPPLSSSSPALPPRNKPPTSPYGTQRMPSPSDYTTTNAWQESNKTLDEDRNVWSASPQSSSSPPPQQPQQQNAYQYSGTPYGNSPIQPASTTDNSNKIETTTSPMSVSDAEATYNTKPGTTLGSKIRWIIRIVLFIFAVGHLGFAAGASPYSGESVPFDSSACFYFLFAVAILSIIYSGYHVIFFFFRRFGHAQKTKRMILILCDLFMALMWGIGIIVEIVKYHCPPGQDNGWCNFYNTSIFFGFVSFVLYVVTLGWDIVGACMNRKK